MWVSDVEDEDDEDDDVEVDSSEDKKLLGETFTVVTLFTGINNGEVTCTGCDVDGFWVFSDVFGDEARILCDVDCSFESVAMLVVFCIGTRCDVDCSCELVSVSSIFCEGVPNSVPKFLIIPDGKRRSPISKLEELFNAYAGPCSACIPVLGLPCVSRF